MNKINNYNISSALQIAEKLLSQNKIKNPLFEAELLLSFILKKNREYIFTYPKKELTLATFNRFKKNVKERCKNIPLAYICEYKYFYGLKFFVNKDVLIPRPETEMMVEEVFEHVTNNMQHATIIDIGTGSGCVTISLIKQLINSKLRITNYEFFASDISSKALVIAKKNAKLNNVKKFVKFYQGDLLEPVIKHLDKSCPPSGTDKIIDHKSKVIITANLPYLTPIQVKNSPSIKKEPRLALVAGNDGLKYYRELFKQIKANAYRLPPTTLFLEIDHTQKSNITNLIKQELPNANFEIKKDLGGHFRLVKISINN